MDKELLSKMIDEGYINVQHHDKIDAHIYNYTAKAQYGYVWNEATMMCRGLILDSDLNILANPFPKFFNMEELERNEILIPEENFEIYDKMDGSLGILYWIGDEPMIASRGSFNSRQAQKATEILYREYSSVFPRLDKKKTYLFEIIYPENRIILDYGNKEDIILLSIRDTKTGDELELEEIGFPIVEKFDGALAENKKGENSFMNLKSINENNKEGFVIKFESGFRMKIKYEEYVRLHRILSNVSNKGIWELLKEEGNINKILERVPDEFYKWARGVEADLISKSEEIEQTSFKDLSELEKYADRKEFASHALKKKYPSVLFKMIDRKPYEEMIWKMVKPKFERPFMSDE